MCKEASMQPVKRIQKSKYFCYDKVNNMFRPYTPSNINEENDLRRRDLIKTYDELQQMNQVSMINDLVNCVYFNNYYLI